MVGKTDMVISLDANEELAAALSADAGIELPSSLSVPLILKDGILYVDVTEVAPFIDGMQEMKGWLGFELGGVIEAAAEQGVFEQAAASMDPEAMASAGAGPQHDSPLMRYRLRWATHRLRSS
jgi:hypothetical protein